MAAVVRGKRNAHVAPRVSIKVIPIAAGLENQALREAFTELERVGLRPPNGLVPGDRPVAPYEAHLYGARMALLPRFCGQSEAAARDALERALRCPLAVRLWRNCHEHFAAEIDAQAFAACVTHRAKINVRTVSDAELTKLARKLEPKARALRAAIQKSDLDGLALILPGASRTFLDALARLSDADARLRELELTPTKGRGNKARGTRAAMLLGIVRGAWNDAFGEDPHANPEMLAAVMSEVLKQYRERVPKHLESWIDDNLEKLKRSTIL